MKNRYPYTFTELLRLGMGGKNISSAASIGFNRLMVRIHQSGPYRNVNRDIA